MYRAPLEESAAMGTHLQTSGWNPPEQRPSTLPCCSQRRETWWELGGPSAPPELSLAVAVHVANHPSTEQTTTSPVDLSVKQTETSLRADALPLKCP